MPLTVWRGHFLDAAAWGPGTASNDLAFLFRDAQANVTLRADTGAYLYCISINGVPQQGIYDFTTVTTNLAFANLDNDQSVIAWFGYRTWSLSIGTPYSTATPAAGAYTITNGTLINASVAAPLHSAENIRRDCSGWTLTGNTPATGSTNQLSFTLTNNATLVWNWNSNLSYKATALADANGAVSPTNAWYQHGVTAAITAYPSTYYHLLNWLGDTNGAVFYDTRMDLQMLGPRTVTSTFAPNLTTAYSVPEYWLAAYGWTQNFETAAATDADRDGMPTWAEWRADTDPTNRSSLLQLTSLQPVSNTCVLIWTGGSLSTQQVERADTPTGAWIQLYTNFPPTALTSSLSLPDNGSNSFYRIRIP